VNFIEDEFPPKQGWFALGEPGLSLSSLVARSIEQSMAPGKKTIAPPDGSRVGERWLPILYMLGNLVEGIERCAILSINPTSHELSFEAVANLSQEFISALAYNGEGQRLMAAAEEAKPYLTVYLPGNRQFMSLWKLAHKEGIKTLWLVPWRYDNGSVFGAFLFALGEDSLPSKEAQATVMLMSAFMSMLFRQDGIRWENGKHRAALDGSGEIKMSTEDNRTTTTRRVARGVFPSLQVQATKGSYRRYPFSFSDRNEPIDTVAPMQKDRHGIPVLYDYSTHEPRKGSQPDAVSVLSHELLSPLTLIKGYTSTLLQMSEVITEEQRGRYLRGIESATNRLIQLLENLRDITGLEGSNTLNAESTCFPHFLRKIVAEIQNQTTKHVIKIHSTGRLPSVKVDRLKIGQVVTNLLSNAMKYSQQGGNIDVDIALVRNEHELKEVFGEVPTPRLPCLIVSVSDSGIGIPNGELERIFRKFYRVNNRLTRSTPGAGLGLYICKTIVHAHGGRIWARSTPNRGSTFSFSLPLD
jgi:signal transduction histidine kinase